MQNRILGIKRFQVYPNKPLIGINIKYEIYLDNSLFLGMIEDAFYIYLWKDIFIIADIYGKAYVVKKDFKLNKFLNLEYSVSNVINNYAIIYRDYNDRTHYGIYDFMKEEILFETELGIGGDIFNNKMYFTRFEDIISFDIDKREILWQFSIADFPPYINGFYREQEADIKQIIGVYNNILWVHVGGFRLVGIDVKSGKYIHYIENVLKGDIGNNFLDVTNGILKTLSFDYYAEFDMKSLQLRKQTTVQNKENIRIRESNFYEGDKYLYFCGYYNNHDAPNAFGIFDTEKAEIVWYDTTKDDLGYFYNPPQANDKLLAVLDDKHNLLVYERDELK
jgi:hypothetical protein